MTKWTPFRIAARLPGFQRGGFNVGNTRQKLANFAALAIANALTNGGRGDWARFRIGFGPLGGSLGTSTTSTAGILVNVTAALAAGGSSGSHILDESGNRITDESGNRITAE